MVISDITNQVKILLIEDSEDDATLIIRLLKKEKFSFDYIVIESREELIKSLDEQWDIVISDYYFPSFNGLEALKIVKEKDPDCPFIIVSGVIEEEMAIEAMREGAYDYIMKTNMKRLPLTVIRALNEAKHEKKRREIEKRLFRIVNNSKDMIFTMSLPDFNYSYVSPASKKIFGYDPEELYRYPNLIRHLDWVNYFQKEWNKILAGNLSPTFEFQIVHKDGSTRWIRQQNAYLIKDESGNPIGIEGICTDITDKKKFIDGLTQVKQQEELYHTMMSHFIKNDLQKITLLAETAAMAGKNEELGFLVNYKKIIDICSNTATTIEIVNKIFTVLQSTFDETKRQKKKPFHLLELIKSTIRELTIKIPINISDDSLMISLLADDFLKDAIMAILSFQIKNIAEVDSLSNNDFQISIDGSESSEGLLFSLEFTDNFSTPIPRNLCNGLSKSIDDEWDAFGHYLDLTLANVIIHRYGGKFQVQPLSRGNKIKLLIPTSIII